jgi:hypothetical protein
MRNPDELIRRPRRPPDRVLDGEPDPPPAHRLARRRNARRSLVGRSDDHHQGRLANHRRARAADHAGGRCGDRRPRSWAAADQPGRPADDRLQRAVPRRRTRPRYRHRGASDPARVAALGDHHRAGRWVSLRNIQDFAPTPIRRPPAATTAPATHATGTPPTPSPTTSPAAPDPGTELRPTTTPLHLGNERCRQHRGPSGRGPQ